ncbi:MAG: glutamine synthetase beta-grasp domain-containing protein, partial [Actinomycetota bacterium]|nr:glutamine synthetase beta-grasp domain-containing protein [Actinomycetota bacterium]
MEERTPAEVLSMVEEEGVAFVDLRFCDLPGVMQHVSIPANVLDEGQFEEGHAFDGSSVRGFQEIQESDMVLVADPTSAYLDPFRAHKTLVLHCDVADPVTGERYSRDPRHIARKAEEHLFSTGIADTAYFGPEPEFFIFDDVRFETAGNRSMYQVDSIEGQWNTGRDEGPNLGYKPRTKEGYFPTPPTDHYQDLRSEMSTVLHQVGIQTELHHHEVASGGQGEIGIRFDTLLHMADKLMTFKYVLKNVAWQHGKSLTFMPKPIFGDNGSGMHVHQSLWKAGKPLFFDEAGYAGLSDLARWYIGGLL